MMTYLYKILVLIVLSALGVLCVPWAIHLMIAANLIDSAAVPPGFLENVVSKAVNVWFGAVLVGVVSLFIQQNWRIVLVLCPLILPPIFTLIYAISQA